jgi:hypothetical protein
MFGIQGKTPDRGPGVTGVSGSRKAGSVSLKAGKPGLRERKDRVLPGCWTLPGAKVSFPDTRGGCVTEVTVSTKDLIQRKQLSATDKATLRTAKAEWAYRGSD